MKNTESTNNSLKIWNGGFNFFAPLVETWIYALVFLTAELGQLGIGLEFMHSYFLSAELGTGLTAVFYQFWQVFTFLTSFDLFFVLTNPPHFNI